MDKIKVTDYEEILAAVARVPYAPWHDVYRNIDEFCVEL